MKKLNRTSQCKTCPWIVGNDVSDIPGYSHELHLELENTIACGTPATIGKPTANMACHYSTEDKPEYCIGWLYNQLGPGNNLGLRMQMMDYGNASEIKVHGEQYENFEDTLPKSKSLIMKRETYKTADQIKANGKLYFTGAHSILSSYAKEAGYSVSTVVLTGHHIYATVNRFAHWKGNTLAKGTPKVDGVPSSDLNCATEDEKEIFFKKLLSQDA